MDGGGKREEEAPAEVGRWRRKALRSTSSGVGASHRRQPISRMPARPPWRGRRSRGRWERRSEAAMGGAPDALGWVERENGRKESGPGVKKSKKF
jgi:hypothetical protein